jgi:hypothetical protein
MQNLWPDPDLKPEPKQIYIKEPYNQTKKQVIQIIIFFLTFTRNNLFRISIFATQFTSNRSISRLHDTKNLWPRLWQNFILAD